MTNIAHCDLVPNARPMQQLFETNASPCLLKPKAKRIIYKQDHHLKYEGS